MEFDPIIISLMSQIAIKGLDDDLTEKLIPVIDTLLDIQDYDQINIANIQTLLLILQDFEIKPTVKRLVEELRYRLIRQSISNSKRGEVIFQYTTNIMNRDIVEKIYDVKVWTGGKIELESTYSIQPETVPVDELVINDLGCLALSTDIDDDIVLALEKFEIPRTGCCGIVRADMIYPIGKDCSETSFIKEALDLANTHNIGSDVRPADTYSIEYFLGKPSQNFREAGKSLYSFELEKDGLWHYYKEGSEVFAKDLEGVKNIWK